MTPYLNKASKEIVVCLSGCAGFMDTLLGLENWRNAKKARRSLKAALNHTLKALDAVLDGVEPDQIQAAINAAKCSHLAMIPHLSPEAGKEYYYCPADALSVILEEPLSACTFCELEGKAARRCKKRKALMQCGIVGREDGDCPYSRF